jgi:hypothetical protein
MEKSCIFAPIIIFFVIFGALIAGFVLLILKLVRKSKKDHWIGTVADKKYFEKDHHEIGEKIGHKEHFYNLVVKMDNGETHTIAASREFYEQCQPGDRLEKKSGELFPKKIS